MYKSKSGVTLRVLMIILIVAVLGLSATFWIVGPKLAAANRIAPDPNRELSPQELFFKASPAVVRVLVRDGKLNVTGLGSGFFISSDGILVTNYHVIKGATSAEVLRADNSTLVVEAVIAADPKNDLALLKVAGSNLPTLSLASGSNPQVGMKVYAIGNPNGLTNTLSEGLISGVRDGSTDLPAIQTTAPISPGSSGGPLLSSQEQVVGVTAAYLKNGQELNFAVPVHYVEHLVYSLDPVLRNSQRDNSSYWYRVGLLHEGLSNYGAAVEAFSKTVKLKPDDTEAWFMLGLAREGNKEDTAAIEAFKTVAKLEPSNAGAYVFTGVAYSDLHDYEAAIKFYRWALKIDPNGQDAAYARDSLGFALVELRQYRRAVNVLQQAISLQPTDALAYCTLGRAYHYMGDNSNATAAFNDSIRLDPNGVHGADGSYANLCLQWTMNHQEW